MAEPCEALDLDDSDISSSSFSLLRHCSFQPAQPPPPHSLSSESRDRSLCSLLSTPPHPPSVSLSPIPGPAGAIQAAMHRKNSLSSPRNVEAAEISTQEYIRRVEKDDGQEFSRSPWVFALDFLRGDGSDATPLRTVKQCLNAERIDKVVAIVKSCKPNGLGDMMVTLKDPTDTVGASVHHKVLSIGECGKLLAAGSVLILQKVVAFYSSNASCYLNITRSNIVKVISPDCAVQSFPEANAQPSSGRDLEMPENTPGLIPRRPEELLGDVQNGHILKGRRVSEDLMGKESSSHANGLIRSRQIQNVASNIPEDCIRIDSGLRALGCFSKFRDNPQWSTQLGPGRAEHFARNHEDLHNAGNRRHLRGVNSAPNINENLDSQHSWQASGSKIGDLLRGNNGTVSMAEKLDIQLDIPAGTNSSTAENLDHVDFAGANDISKQRQHGDISSLQSMADNVASLANQEANRTNDSQKRRQSTDTVSNARTDVKQDQEVNNTKKPRLPLISRTSVQEWTDEQLDILDIDWD